MKKVFRLLSVATALCVIISMFTFSALATEADGFTDHDCSEHDYIHDEALQDQVSSDIGIVASNSSNCPGHKFLESLVQDVGFISTSSHYATNPQGVTVTCTIRTYGKIYKQVCSLCAYTPPNYTRYTDYHSIVHK